MSEWGGRRAQALLALVLATYGNSCTLCGSPIRLDLPRRHPDGPSVEHLRPRSKGGSDDLPNLRPAHLRCNSARGNRPHTDASDLPAEHDGRAFFQPATPQDTPRPVSFSPRGDQKNPGITREATR